jgi:uncharacterized protein (TIGR03382 family)
LPLSACTNTDPNAVASTINHGCYQTTATCAADPNAPACTSYTDPNSCGQNDCSWQTSPVCTGSTACELGNNYCFSSDFTRNGTTLLPGCAISACSGTVACSDYQTGNCPTNIDAAGDSCSNGPTCSSLTDANSCAAAAGCVADDYCGFPSVVVTASSLSQAQTEANAQCAAMQGCSGTADFNASSGTSYSFTCEQSNPPLFESCTGTSSCTNPAVGAVTCSLADCNIGIYGCSVSACSGTTACTSEGAEGCGDGGTCHFNGCDESFTGCLTASCIDPGRTCSASNCQTASYCDYTAAQCQTIGSGLSCSNLLDEQACQAEANGCGWNPSGSCASTTSVSCANLEPSQCGTPEFPGCAPTTCPTAKDAADVIIFRSGAGCSATHAGSLVVTVVLALLWAARRRKPS